VFRAGAGNQFYIDVNDNGPGAGTYKEARIRGYETMTAVATGTGPFPTVAQQANGLFVRKSVALDATTREWVVIADSKTFYFFAFSGDTAGSCTAYMFGDFYSLLTGDGYRTMIIGKITENSGTAAGDRLDVIVNGGNNTFTGSTSGHYIARGYTGLGTSITIGKVTSHEILSTSACMGSGSMAFPNPTDGGIYLSRVMLQEAVTSAINSRRGYMRGLWAFGHVLGSVDNGNTFTGTGDLSGRSFLVIKQSGNGGSYIMETSDTWDTSS
jgi:hypothetical protein